MARGDLGGDPTTDAIADEIELRKLKRVQDFKVVEDNVFDGVDVLVLVRLRAAGVSWRDQASVLGQSLMKRQVVFFHRVNVGETVKIEQGGAAALFQNPDFASVDIDIASAQWSASADDSTLTPGYS